MICTIYILTAQMIFSDAYTELERDEFTNITGENQKGKSIKQSDKYIILSQNIPQGEKIDKNTEIQLICQKVTDYMDDHFLGITVEKASEEAEALNYAVSYYQKFTGSSMNARISDMNDQELSNWTVAETGLDKNVARLGLVYRGSRDCPNIVGLSLAEAEMILEENDFINHDYETVTKEMVFDKDNWQVIYQSIEPGSYIDVNTKINMKVQSYKSITEEGILLR